MPRFRLARRGRPTPSGATPPVANWPSGFLYTDWQPQTSILADQIDWGINLALGKVNSQSEADWDAGCIAAGIARCRQIGASAGALATDDAAPVFKVLDEPDKYNLDNIAELPPGYTLLPGGVGVDLGPEIAAIRAITNKPIYCNLLTVSVVNRWGVVETEFLKNSEIGLISTDYYAVDSQGPFLMSSFNPAGNFPASYLGGRTFTTTPYGMALWSLSEMGVQKPVGAFIQTADFGRNGRVPTVQQNRCLFWSHYINGGAIFSAFTQQGLYGSGNILPFKHDGTGAEQKTEWKRWVSWLELPAIKRASFDRTQPMWRRAFTLRRCPEADGNPDAASPVFKVPLAGQMPAGFEACTLTDPQNGDQIAVILNITPQTRTLTDATYGLTNISFSGYDVLGINLTTGSILFSSEGIRWPAATATVSSVAQLQAALASATPGQRILVAAGAYNNVGFGTARTLWPPVHVSAADPANPPVFTSASTSGPVASLNNWSGLILDGIRFTMPTTVSAFYRIVEAFDVENVDVRNCEIVGNENGATSNVRGIDFGAPRNVLLYRLKTFQVPGPVIYSSSSQTRQQRDIVTRHCFMDDNGGGDAIRHDNGGRRITMRQVLATGFSLAGGAHPDFFQCVISDRNQTWNFYIDVDFIDNCGMAPVGAEPQHFFFNANRIVSNLNIRCGNNLILGSLNQAILIEGCPSNEGTVWNNRIVKAIEDTVNTLPGIAIAYGDAHVFDNIGQPYRPVLDPANFGTTTGANNSAIQTQAFSTFAGEVETWRSTRPRVPA